MKVMSDGQLSKEEYKIIDTLEIFELSRDSEQAGGVVYGTVVYF